MDSGHQGQGHLQASGETAGSLKDFRTMLDSPPLGSARADSAGAQPEAGLAVTCSHRHIQYLQVGPLVSTPSSSYPQERERKTFTTNTALQLTASLFPLLIPH